MGPYEKIILPMIVSSCLLAACQKKSLHQEPDLGFNATVMQKGMDCGNSYLVKFDSTVQGCPPMIWVLYTTK